MSRKFYIGKALLATLALIALAALLTSPIHIFAQGKDPESVVKALGDAFNAKNVEAIVAFFADDAVVVNQPCSPGVKCTWTGKDELRQWAKDAIAQNLTLEYGPIQVSGDKATYLIKMCLDPYRALNVCPMELNTETVVQGGLIKSSTRTFTDKWLAQFRAVRATATASAAAKAAATASPPASLPKTGEEPIPTNAVIAALFGLAILAGLGLSLRRRGA